MYSAFSFLKDSELWSLFHLLLIANSNSLHFTEQTLLPPQGLSTY